MNKITPENTFLSIHTHRDSASLDEIGDKIRKDRYMRTEKTKGSLIFVLLTKTINTSHLIFLPSFRKVKKEKRDSNSMNFQFLCP